MAQYPEQCAGGVDGGFGEQLAGQVEVGFGLDGGQSHCGGCGEEVLAGGPGPQLLHRTLVALIKVEASTGRPWLHSFTLGPVKRHHRETKRVDQGQGVFEQVDLSQRDS